MAIIIFVIGIWFLSGIITEIYAASTTCTTNLAGTSYLCQTTANGATCTPKTTLDASGQVDIGGAGTVYIPINPCGTNVCITTNYCCDATNSSSCGYAILRTGGTSYLCQDQVPLTCLTNENLCFPERYNCKPLNGGAFPGIAPTFTPTPTASASATTPASGSSLLELKKKIYNVGYPSFGDITKQALFLIPLFIALMWIL